MDLQQHLSEDALGREEKRPEASSLIKIPQEEDEDTSSDFSDKQSDSSSNESPRGAWIADLQMMLSLPMMFPYHIATGYSVAQGLSSSSGSSSCVPSSGFRSAVASTVTVSSPSAYKLGGGSHDLKGFSSTCSSLDDDGGCSSSSSSLQSVEKGEESGIFALPIWELLESLHEDYLQSHRPNVCLTYKRQNPDIDNIERANARLKQMNLQVSLIKQVGSLETHGAMLAKLLEKMATLAQDLGYTFMAAGSWLDALTLRKALYSRDNNSSASVGASNCTNSREAAEALATAHARLADCRRQQGHWKDAMDHYQGALSVLEEMVFISEEEGWDVRMADILYKMGQTVSAMVTHNGNLKASLAFLHEAETICHKILARKEETCKEEEEEEEEEESHSGNESSLLGHILIAIGTANVRQGQMDEALRCYQDGLSMLKREGKKDEAILDAVVGIGDLHCRRDNAHEALNFFLQVKSEHEYSCLYEYCLLKRAILHMKDDNIGSALVDLSSYVDSFHRKQEESDNSQADLAYFIAMLSMGACHQVQKRRDQANNFYKAAHSLVARPDCPLLVQNPMLDTTLWNFMDDWLNADNNE